MQIPPLKGLVLIGGHSSRMGFDKSRIEYHGIPQANYMAGLINLFMDRVYLSGRSGQVNESVYPMITDENSDGGPMNGVLSAFAFDPQCAWLITACDMPMISRSSVEQLISSRDPGKMATCFFDAVTGIPEPLLSIWEPAAFIFLQKQMKDGNQSLQHTLKIGDCKFIEAKYPEEFLNVNTEEEMNIIMKKLK